jgi:hypothetical protein
VIVPLADRRAEMTATMKSPGNVRGRAIESEVPLPVRAVVASRSVIGPCMTGPGAISVAVNGLLLAGAASVPATAMEPMKAVKTAVKRNRGRLPNMASPSAQVLGIRKPRPLFCVPRSPDRERPSRC